MFLKRLMKAVLRASLVMLSSAALFWGSATYAEKLPHPLIVGPSADFITYAAFAKLESNVAEATLNVFLHAKASAEERKAILADFDDDAGSIKLYSTQLEGQKLTGEAAEALAQFKKDWTSFEKNAREAMYKGDNVTLKELHEIYVTANKMDDAVDHALESLRDKMTRSAS